MTEYKCCIHPCSAFECPEAVCVEDKPNGRASARSNSRAQRAREMRAEGKSLSEIASALGVGKRAVQLYLEVAVPVG